MKNTFKYSNCNPKRPLSIIFPTHHAIQNVMYHALAKQNQLVYTNSDGITAYNSSPILSPSAVSYINFFVNGVIQPLNTYSVETGKLTLLSETAPIPGTPLTLQFLTLY
ncbi:MULTISPECIES: DUF4183 domain-containing protein [Bacillus cereus group]|uniref:DUF4183 domain-containing protein n=1 Tax=Bacillus cereus group TaxID=86661 RepID=UPI000BF21522|nr:MULTISPECIES: DUF4183 domain-containing protein [Bacillus cereus group]PEJ60500.1 hypothetical protein CN685_27825 [Bacillus wiedmannii]UIJ67038.1 DUF4183 domain-containing protein [Bacillus cereus]